MNVGVEVQLRLLESIARFPSFSYYRIVAMSGMNPKQARQTIDDFLSQKIIEHAQMPCRHPRARFYKLTEKGHTILKKWTEICILLRKEIESA